MGKLRPLPFQQAEQMLQNAVSKNEIDGLKNGGYNAFIKGDKTVVFERVEKGKTFGFIPTKKKTQVQFKGNAVEKTSGVLE